MWELDYKERWVPKNWCFWTVVLEKTLESPLDCKEIQPVHPKGDQSWVFIGRTDAEAETPILCLAKRGLKVGGEGDDRGWDGWMASLTQWTWIWVNSRKQWRTGKLACCSPQGRKESDTTEGLNNSNCAKNMFYIFENFYWWKRWCLTVNNSINIYWTSSICQRVLSYWEFSKKENRNSPYSLGFCILRKESN